ncbi:MAG: hypothetical protein HY263_11405 [Chloroflexi bacterium]|nr:hypothetical protein [Chloroflexota bacterium]
MSRSRPTRPVAAPAVAALAVVAALVATACLPAGQHFHAIASGWLAEIDDLSGSIVAVRAEAEPSPADAPLPGVDAIAVRNLAPDRIEIGWRGQPATDTPGWFTFTSTAAGLMVRYEVIAPADAPSGVTYAFEVRFNHPVAASSITARPADWP